MPSLLRRDMSQSAGRPGARVRASGDGLAYGDGRWLGLLELEATLGDSAAAESGHTREMEASSCLSCLINGTAVDPKRQMWVTGAWVAVEEEKTTIALLNARRSGSIRAVDPMFGISNIRRFVVLTTVLNSSPSISTRYRVRRLRQEETPLAKRAERIGKGRGGPVVAWSHASRLSSAISTAKRIARQRTSSRMRCHRCQRQCHQPGASRGVRIVGLRRMSRTQCAGRQY